MAANNIWELTACTRVEGQRCVNVFHFREETAGTTVPEAKAVAVMFDTIFHPLWAACVSEDLEFECYYVRRVQPQPGLTFLLQATVPILGQVAEEAVPSNASACMALKSALANKHGRGRKYFAGVPESHQQAGKLSIAALALWDTFANEFEDEVGHTGPGGELYRAVVYSRAQLTAEDIIIADMSPSIATMRSRRQPYGMIV